MLHTAPLPTQLPCGGVNIPILPWGPRAPVQGRAACDGHTGLEIKVFAPIVDPTSPMLPRKSPHINGLT